MDANRRFSCIFLMKATFPPLLPNNPIKIKVTAEIDPEKLSFISVGPGKTVAIQPLAKIGSVTVQPVSANAQRLEVFLISMARLGVIAVLLFIWTLCKNSSEPMDISYYVLVMLGAIILVLPLSLLLSGILASRHDILRFQFNSLKNNKLLSIEVEPRQESEVRQALVSAGLQFTASDDSQGEWECERCGATVDADTTVCPVCGDRLD